MPDPLSLFPFALAAGGGRIDGHDITQLIAAGTTLLQRSAPLVRALSGKRSAILLPTSAAYFTALAASDGRGAVLVNPLASPREIAMQLGEADVGAVFTIAPLASRLPVGTPMVLLDDAPRQARVIIDSRTNDIDLGSHFGLPLEGATDAEGSDEEAIVVYSSGMNGYMRGARLTHRNLLSSARSTIVASAMDSDSHSLALLPMAHLFGLVVSTGAPLLAGARVTTMDRYNPVRALELIATEGVTHLSAVPSVYAGLLQAMERRGAPFIDHALRVCIVGGAPLDVSLQDRWAEMTRVELRQGYGLTEAGPVCSFNLASLPNRRGTIGVPFPGVELSIRSVIGDDDELPSGDVGEICVRGVNVFAGYVGNAVDALTVRNGWLRTGDLGIRGRDGSYEFRGLTKAMFTRNGFNIYPHEIERVVCELPGVERASVSAAPDPVKENEIVLDVVGTVSEDAVREWCAKNLSVYKQPTVIRVSAG
jgi:long-chain acyl-CoA synthetase